MLVGIGVLAIFMLPTVLGHNGQPAEFEQECHILRTLDSLESRLKEQDDRLKLQEKLLEQQQAQISYLEANMTASNQSNEQRIGFTARRPADAATSGVIRFTDVITNNGSDYDSSTGVFRCSRSGLYFFSLHLTKFTSTNVITVTAVDYVWCHIYRNDDSVAYAYTNPVPDADIGRYGISTSAVIYLSPGDVVYPGDCTAASTMFWRSSFSGFLIGAD